MFYEGVSGKEFTVGRLSQPRLLIRAESGKVIKSVMLNDVDVTAELHGGYLDLTPVYEDEVITVTTEDEPLAPKETYTVKGKVTLNGQPLSEVDLELRSTLKTTKTDKNGNFAFSDIEPGKQFRNPKRTCQLHLIDGFAGNCDDVNTGRIIDSSSD